MNEHDALFAQLATLGASLVLLFGIALLWRHSLRAYTKAFQWQSLVLSAMFILVGYFGHDPQSFRGTSIGCNGKWEGNGNRSRT